MWEGFWSWEREWEWFKGGRRRDKKDLLAILKWGEKLGEFSGEKQKGKREKNVGEQERVICE